MTKKLDSLKLSKKLDSFLNKIISPEFIEKLENHPRFKMNTNEVDKI